MPRGGCASRAHCADFAYTLCRNHLSGPTLSSSLFFRPRKKHTPYLTITLSTTLLPKFEAAQRQAGSAFTVQHPKRGKRQRKRRVRKAGDGEVAEGADGSGDGEEEDKESEANDRADAKATSNANVGGLEKGVPPDAPGISTVEAVLAEPSKNADSSAITS